jgi:hypothetical protein
MALPAGFQLEEPLGLPTGFQLENTAPEKPPETGIIAGLKSGVNQFLSPAQTGIQALLGNEEEAARAGLKRQEEEAKKFEGPSFARIGQKYDQNGVLSAAKEVATDIPVALAQQAPLITAMGVGSWIGGGIGGTLGGIGGSFVTPVVGTAAGAVGGAALGAKVGSAIGQAIVEFPQFFGSNIERQAQEQIKAGKSVDIDKTNAAVSAMGQTATDIFEMQVLFGGKYLGNLLGLSEKELANKSVGALEKQAREKFLPSISEGTLGYGVKGTAKGMAVEIPTEIAQQMMERAQAGLSLTSPDALAEYGDTAYQVGLLGPLGVVGSMANKSGAKGELEKRALDQEQKDYQAKVDEYKKLQDQLSQTYQNLGVNNVGENGRPILALPAPAPQVLEETGHPLQNPLGNFGVDALHPEEVKYLDQYRNQLGLPKLQSYSIEDIKDAMTNLHPEGEQGVIDRLLTTKLGYTGQEVAGKPVTAKDVENIANLRNLDTTTSGFSDFLTRTTGHDDLATLSNPQLLSVFNAISSTERSPELQILQPSTNATAFSQTQYDKALDGVKAVLGMGNRTTATDNTILNEVKDFTGLTDKHAKALLKTAINNGDLEAYSKHRFDVVDANGKPLPMIFPKTREEAQAIAKKKGLDPENNVKATAYQEISLPGVINKLPVGPDIRQETFKQGVEPAFTVQRGNQTVSAPLNEQEAQTHLDDLQKQQDLNIRNLQTQIKAKQLAIKQSKTILDRLALDGKKDTSQYQQVAAHIADKNNKLQLEIDRLNNQVLTQDYALDLIPAGEKPVLSTGFTYYHNGQKTSTFPTIEEAQDFSVTRMDDKLLNQIIASAPAQKGLIPKRLEVMAKKELDRRAGKGQKGIAVTAIGTKEEASKNLAKMGIYSPLVTEHLEELRNKLIPDLKRFGLEKVGLRILNSIENGKADGFYVRGLMTVAYDSANPTGTLRHETIHALRELGGFRPEEWKVLMNKAKSEWIDTYIKKTGLYEKYKAQFESDHGNLDGFDDYISEEAIAEAFKHFSKTKPPAGLVGNLYHRISELFKSLFKAFRSIGATSVEEIFSNIEEGKIQPIDLSKAGEEVKFAKNLDEPRKLPNGNIVGSPPNAKDERSRTALVKRMTNLLEHPFSMYEKSKDWYERSGDTIREVSHGDKDLMEKLIRLTALYSQANSLGGNITAVIKSMAQIANGDKEILAGRFPNTTAKRIPVILAAKTMDDSVAGVDDKLMNFYRNLHDGTFKTDTFQDASTIDRWMMRLFDYPHAEDQDEGGASSISATQYKYAKDLIRRIADANEKKTGDKLHPRQIQAVLWTYVKNQSEEKKHNENPKKKGEFVPSALDFSDYMNRATAHITWESRPSTSIDLIPGIHEAPKKYQHQFNQAIHSIFTNKDGSNKIMEMLSKLVGNHVMYSSDLSVGAYEDKVTPNIITKVVLQKDEKEHLVEIADMYSNVIGFVTKQNAVAWYRPDPTASGKNVSKGIKVTTDQTMNQKFIDSLFKHLNSEIPGIGFTKVGESLDFINFRNAEGKPEISDKKFTENLNKALESFNPDVDFKALGFKAQSNYLFNDWTENQNGQSYLDRFSAGQLSDIQSTLDHWRSDYERIAKEFGDEHKWHKYALRPEQSAIRPSGRSTEGIVLGEKQEQAVSFEGIHYGKEKTNELRGNYSGSGIKGAEQARLAKAEDRRIKNRVYFYIPRSNEIMPFREAGLGNFVYEQKFDNILAPGETMRSLNTGDFNEFESNVIEAGFDGYAVPDMGMMVILNHDVPVEYKGTIDELRSSTESADIRYALALDALEPTTYLVSDAHPNNTGDLAYIPFNASIPKMPIRMTVGTHDNILNKGYGGNHILTRIRENPNRKPDVSASDLLENIILQAEETGKKFTQIYKDNSQYILFDPLSKNMMVIHPEKGFYSITTMYKDERVPFKHGNPIWSGRNIQPPVTQAFQEKQQGFPVRAGERGIETMPVKTTVKKRRVITPSQVENKTYALRIDNAPPLKLTKLAPAQTAGQKIHDVITAIQNSWHSDDFFTGLRVAWIDPSAGLSNRLQGKDAWDMHGLRADMLHRAKSQMINIIHNGLQIGIPVLNKDKSIVIERTEDNLARTHIMADALDANPYVQRSDLTGRGFVAEVARALRGREILAEDKARQAEGIKQLEQAKQLVREANKATTVKEQRRLLSQAEHLRKLGNENKQMNRELQVTPEQLAWAEQQLKNVPEIQNILDIWKSVNNSLIDLREATGLLTKAQADDYRSKESYVPLFMAEEDLEDHFGSLRPSGAKSIKEIQRLKGSELTRNIWENLERNFASTIALAYENQTRKVAVDQLVSVDAAKISTASDPEVNLRFKDDQHPDADSHGIVHAVVYNPNDVLAFQNMHYELTPLMKGFSAVTNVLRAGALLNPMFWIRQIIRDSFHATMVTDSGIVTPFHAAKEFINILKNDSREFSILFERGVVGPRDSTVDFHDFLSQVGQEKTKTTTIKKAIHKIMMYHESSDAATRVSIFKDAEKKALAQGMSPEDAVNFAVYKARESINFSVHGNGKILNDLRHMIPFFSASITSLDTVYRAATGYGLPPKEKAAAQKLFKQRAMMMVVMCTAYAMMMQDDDEYKKQPDYVKDGNWLIPTGSGFIKVPVPFEVGFLFKTIPEAAVRYMAGTSTGKEVIASYQSGLIQNLPGNLVPIPQAGRPLLEVITNYSFFRSQAIESVGDQNLPVSQRGRNASEVAKMLSGLGLDKIRLSPAKIDYLIQGYMAELGTSSTNLASSVLYMAEGKTPPDTNFEKMPFFKSFMTDPNADKAVSDFYNIEKNSTEVADAFNKMKASGMGKEAMEYMAQGKNAMLIAYAPTMRRLGLQMTKIRKAINIVESDQSMSPTERRTRMNELTQMYNRVAEQNVKIARTAGLE